MTVITILVAIPTLIAGLLGMNVSICPSAWGCTASGAAWEFWVILAILSVALTAVSSFLLAKDDGLGQNPHAQTSQREKGDGIDAYFTVQMQEDAVKKFEELVKSHTDKVVCPDCGGETERDYAGARLFGDGEKALLLHGALFHLRRLSLKALPDFTRATILY